MFEFISQKMSSALSGLFNSKEITPAQIDEAIRQVRMVLLEADVNFSVVKQFAQSLRDKVQGLKRLPGVDPTQQIIKIVHDEIVILLGGEPADSIQDKEPKSWQTSLKFDPKLLGLDRSFTSILLCGLQGCGKTTQVAKLARYIRKNAPHKKILIAACDRQRPQAVQQLQVLCEPLEIEVFTSGSDALDVSRKAYQKAQSEGYSVLITDTAGRLYLDEPLMQELESIKSSVVANEVLFVANAMMGQDVAKSALSFHERLNLTGSIVTMLDSDAKGGAVLSIHMMTKVAILFEGVGEKVDDLQPFNPHSMADRMLGMGDTINLVRRMQEQVTEEQSKKLENKILTASFTYDDFLSQLQALERMGPLSSLMKMLPGAASMPFDEKKIVQSKAIILSMNKKEREQKVELSVSRRKRIAKGSGLRLDDVNSMLKTFEQMKALAKNMPNLKQQMKKALGGFSWR
jgi:signal recognition particle subunit SRP54